MTFNTSSILAVGMGGFIGANMRFYVGLQVAKYFPYTIPLATLFVNIAGSFIMGILIGIFTIITPSDSMKLFLLTGLLGALTTFSTFAMESFILLENNTWYGVLNIIMNVVGSILSATIGYKIIVSLFSIQVP